MDVARDDLPPEFIAVLPGDTAVAWRAIAPLVPASGYLVGGTAIAAHLHHRTSRDLDFFLGAREALLELNDVLAAAGPWAATTATETTLNGVFGATKVQFLEASTQTTLEPTTRIAGVDVASLPDLFAMKLKVVGDRGELRDYFDLMVIEQKTNLRAEEGLDLFVQRYHPVAAPGAVAHIILGLGYFGDVDDDNLLPQGSFKKVQAYWTKRQPSVARSAGRYG